MINLTTLDEFVSGNGLFGWVGDWAEKAGAVVVLNIVTYTISAIITFYDKIMGLIKFLVMKLLGRLLKPIIWKFRVSQVRRASLLVIDNLSVYDPALTVSGIYNKIVSDWGVKYINKFGTETFKKAWHEIQKEIKEAVEQKVALRNGGL